MTVVRVRRHKLYEMGFYETLCFVMSTEAHTFIVGKDDAYALGEKECIGYKNGFNIRNDQ